MHTIGLTHWSASQLQGPLNPGKASPDGNSRVLYGFKRLDFILVQWFKLKELTFLKLSFEIGGYAYKFPYKSLKHLRGLEMAWVYSHL